MTLKLPEESLIPSLGKVSVLKVFCMAVRSKLFDAKRDDSKLEMGVPISPILLNGGSFNESSPKDISS